MVDRVSDELGRRAKLAQWRENRLAERRRVMDEFPGVLRDSLAAATQYPCEVIRSISDGLIEERLMIARRDHFKSQDAVGVYFYVETNVGVVVRTRVCEMRVAEMDGLEAIGTAHAFCTVYRYLWSPFVDDRVDEHGAAQTMVNQTIEALADAIEAGGKVLAPVEGSARIAAQEAWYRE